MGSNGYGQLGDGTWSSKSSPVLLPKFTQADKIVDISAGNQCSAALDNAGKVYTWGYNGHGQLAHSNYSTYTSPKLVETDKAMVSVNMDYDQLALIQKEVEIGRASCRERV